MSTESTSYQTRLEQYKIKLEETASRIYFLSNIRLGLIVVSAIILWYSRSTEAWVLCSALLIGFIICIDQYAKKSKEKRYYQNLVRIQEIELAAQQGDYNALPTGSNFLEPHHPFAHDLDLFGESSLFQYVNRCQTYAGQSAFANSLKIPSHSKEEVLQRQHIIQELSAYTDYRQDIQAYGMEIDEKPTDRKQLEAWRDLPTFLFGNTFISVMRWALPIATVLAFLFGFFFPYLTSIGFTLVLVQWSFVGYYTKRVSAFHEYISSKKMVLEKYATILGCISKGKFKSDWLQQRVSYAQEAKEEMKHLATLVNYLNARSNFLMNMAVNSLFMYELQCVYALEKWKHRHANNLTVWLDTVSDVEAFCSWATFAYNHPTYSYATISSALELRATELKHPLILHKAVANDTYIGGSQRIQIVTGANMAGKSTFLRTIGVNFIIALAGAPVAAKAFTCGIMQLRTGMRATDSLKDQQSYFFAELDRLKSIMDELRSSKPLLILLDEILKGTNSNDKLSGSIALVKQLIPHHSLALIATHDLALGALEQTHADAVKNFCFEAIIENDQLSFDYTLKNGLAKKMNATFLMKKMGIIPKEE
jgi:DNA mismatch repair ATPase MutS